MIDDLSGSSLDVGGWNDTHRLAILHHDWVRIYLSNNCNLPSIASSTVLMAGCQLKSLTRVRIQFC